MTKAAAALAAPPEFRDRAHDLRNLFGAIVSARHMLDDQPDEARRALLLDAIEEAAMRGGALTTRMLAAVPDNMRERFDPGARLRRLEPLLNSVTGTGHRLTIEAETPPALVRGSADRFDHIALELVSNARDALAGAGRIYVRLRLRHDRIVLLVADTGRGMNPVQCHAVLNRTAEAGVHGTGLQQIRRFARDSHGDLRIRSASGHGTVVLLRLPRLLDLHHA